MATVLDPELTKEIEGLKEGGTYKHLRYLDSPMAPEVEMEGQGRVLIFSSNNYLGLASHPEVINAGIEALKRWGVGTASVRFICGTFTVHRMLEEKLASFIGTEAALTYVSCWNANEGFIPTLVGPEDAIFSDELNHASIIDACRLARKTPRFIYKHCDTSHLKRLLEENKNARRKIIATDGVFSMEGDLAPLPDLVELAREYNAILMVDDSHATGVLGERGRGTAEYFGLVGEIDVITSTIGKALGGAAGGFVAASRPIIETLVQHSRPQLFSNALPPPVAACALKALEILEREPERVKKLHDNVRLLREKLKEKGFSLLESPSAIVPIMIGDTAKAIKMSDALLERGIFVTGFGYPVVPEGTARLRIQVSAAHTEEHIERVVEALSEVSKAL